MALEEIEKQEQENSGMLSELADNYAVREKEKTQLGRNLEQQVRERLEKWEKVRESGWLDDYRKKIEEGLLDELQELAGQVKTDLGNIRGSLALMEGMLETRASNQRKSSKSSRNREQGGRQRGEQQGHRAGRARKESDQRSHC